MIKYVKIKHRFDAPNMQKEVYRMEEGFWKPHYNKKQSTGGWTILPLRSINGSPENGISIHGASLQNNMGYKDTALLANSLYLQSVIHFFEAEKMSVRLMNLAAGAVIKEHTDHEMSFEEGEARFHIPILSNSGVDFFIEEEKIPMKQGECWYLNLSLKHHVYNRGKTDRIHLVIDCKVNDWISNLLMEDIELRQEVTGGRQSDSYAAGDKIKIIQELRAIGTSIANKLADQMEVNSA